MCLSCLCIKSNLLITLFNIFTIKRLNFYKLTFFQNINFYNLYYNFKKFRAKVQKSNKIQNENQKETKTTSNCNRQRWCP